METNPTSVPMAGVRPSTQFPAADSVENQIPEELDAGLHVPKTRTSLWAWLPVTRKACPLGPKNNPRVSFGSVIAEPSFSPLSTFQS